MIDVELLVIELHELMVMLRKCFLKTL